MHRIFYLYPILAVGIGYHLSTTIQSGETWAIVLQSFACLFIIIATILAYRCFFLRGKITAYEEKIKFLEKIKKTVGRTPND